MLLIYTPTRSMMMKLMLWLLAMQQTVYTTDLCWQKLRWCASSVHQCQWTTGPHIYTHQPGREVMGRWYTTGDIWIARMLEVWSVSSPQRKQLVLRLSIWLGRMPDCHQLSVVSPLIGIFRHMDGMHVPCIHDVRAHAHTPHTHTQTHTSTCLHTLTHSHSHTNTTHIHPTHSTLP